MSERAQFFEEFLIHEEGVWPKCLGIRLVDENPENRTLGFDGRREFALTQPITLKKGHREVTYKASQKKPLHVRTMLQRLEGELK